MKRSAAAVSVGFGLRSGGRSLSTRDRALVGFAVLVVVPSVALGRHVLSLPSLVERGVAWLVPGSNEGAQPQPVSGERTATPATSPSALVDPLLAGVRPARDGAPVAVAFRLARRTSPATRVVGAGVPDVSGVAGPAGSTPPTVAPPPGAAPTTTAAPGGSGTPPAAGESGSGSDGGAGDGPVAGGPISSGPGSTPNPSVSVGISAGVPGGPVPVAASAGASSSGVSAGVSAGPVSAGASAPLPPVPTATTSTPAATPAVTVAPATTPVLTTPALTVPTVTVTVPPVHLP